MGQALYRKYRSRKLSEIVGQEHITQTLEQALKQGRISHAYLLTGPRGVGKTSVARILAHEINGLPYDDDSTHLDIIEIDAASNRRIDEIRELRDKVYVAPTEAKYKVYIIDEVHMLTREAFNALLKTLEEPPAHAVFILATTDAHKLPETIISRTQRFSFKPVAKDEVTAHLADIAKREKLKVSPEALELLAEHGEGSFRDSISMLDQAASQDGRLELADAQRLLGIPPTEAIDGLVDQLAAGTDASGLMRRVDDLYGQGYQAAAIAKQLGQTIRRQLVDGQAVLDSGRSLALLQQLLAVPAAHDPARLLEIIILGMARPSAAATPTPSVKTSPEETVTEEKKTVKNTVEEAPKPAKVAAKPAKKGAAGKGKAIDAAVWPEVLNALKRRHNTVYSIVRMAQPRFDGQTVQLVFAFAFHQKRLNDTANRQLLAAVIEELTGQPVTIECVFDETAVPPSPASPPQPAQPEELTAISNIFGGGELLES
ncbi:MAG TPA: DNA polymerase III subunit gamma/tau [Candidatus Saccharimonadales bacterium]|nr:DNA polymerase III subunit gamma/tau [Candidatus Saccharimonadales bacterium]